MSRLVLLAHGSPDPRSGAAVRTAADILAARTGRDVAAAFLDHDLPRLADALGPDQSAAPVEVLPLLLSRAFHARVDVPAAVAALPRPVHLREPLGHPAAVLDHLLTGAGGPVVVVAAGTRVDAERAALSSAVTDAAVRTGVPAVAAFATGPGPRPIDVADPGTVILPWLLAPGRLLDAVLAGAGDRPVVARCGLLAEPALLTVLEGLVAAAPVRA